MVSGTSPNSDLDLLLEAFEQADLGVVARQHALGAGELDQQRHQRRHQPIHALRQRLQHQVVAVAIDDERRQQVGLAVNQSVRGGVDLERCRGSAMAVFEAVAPERGVDRPVVARRASAA